MAKITQIHAREILDSRGRPTVEADVHLEDGIVGRASVPSGASTGAAEACELRDGDPARYEGLGVLRAVRNVNDVIAPALAGCESANQHEIDSKLIELDGTPTKSRLGANAILAVSLASARAAAISEQKSLHRHIGTLCHCQPRVPLPMVNMISGGKHAGGNLDFQDVLIVPGTARDYSTQLEWIIRVYRRLGKLLSDTGYEGYLVGDEGGYGPRLKSNRDAVEFVVRAIEAAGLAPGSDVTIALDVAASHFYRDGNYYLAAEGGNKLTSSQMIDRLEQWLADFPITSIEDGLAENDWAGYTCIVSARSGETEDDFLADLAVGTAADYIKIGSVARSERLAKYNRLLRIAEGIKDQG